MSKLSLREIKQSQLDETPIIDGQLIVCLDTGNAYRDSEIAHVKISSDLEVVSELPLAPLVDKIYLLKPSDLYLYQGGSWTLLNDTDFSISTNKNADNGSAQIILDGAKESNISIRGAGATTVRTNSEGELIINTVDPNDVIATITNSEIDKILQS